MLMSSSFAELVDLNSYGGVANAYVMSKSSSFAELVDLNLVACQYALDELVKLFRGAC